MEFPDWLSKEHELNGDTFYRSGSDTVYGVLILRDTKVYYELHLNKDYKVRHESRDFYSSQFATSFYVMAAEKMKNAGDRGRVLTWKHFTE